MNNCFNGKKGRLIGGVSRRFFLFLFFIFIFYGKVKIYGKAKDFGEGVGFSARALRGPRFFLSY